MKTLRLLLFLCNVFYTYSYTYQTQPDGMPIYNTTSDLLPLCEENAKNTGNSLCRCTECDKVETYLIRPGQSCINGVFSLGDPLCPSIPDDVQEVLDIINYCDKCSAIQGVINAINNCSYDPCKGKQQDCQCNVCPPEDENCFETSVIKSCQSENNTLVCKPANSVKNCDITCADIDCGIFNTKVYTGNEVNRENCCDTRSCPDYDCRGVYRNTDLVSVDLTKTNCCQVSAYGGKLIDINVLEKLNVEKTKVKTRYGVTDKVMEDLSTQITQSITPISNKPVVLEAFKSFGLAQLRIGATTSIKRKECAVRRKMLEKVIIKQLEMQMDVTKVPKVAIPVNASGVKTEYLQELERRKVKDIVMRIAKPKPPIPTCADADIDLAEIGPSDAYKISLQHVGNTSIKCNKNVFATKMTLMEVNEDDFNKYKVDCYNGKQWESTWTDLKEDDDYHCPVTGNTIFRVGSDSGAFAGCDGDFAPVNGNDGDCTILNNSDSCQPGCNPGFVAIGRSTCIGDNQFDPKTVCWAGCNSGFTPINGAVGNCTTLNVGETCQPTCNAGFTPSGSTTCSGRNTFSSKTTCAFAGCNSGFAPDNGAVGNCTTLNVGETCQPTCNAGFTPSGSTTCSGRNIFSSQTTCEALCMRGWAGSDCVTCSSSKNSNCKCAVGFSSHFNVGGGSLCFSCNKTNTIVCDLTKRGTDAECTPWNEDYNYWTLTTGSLYSDSEGNQLCSDCDKLDACPGGQERKGCGEASKGECQEINKCQPHPCNHGSCTNIRDLSTTYIINYNCTCDLGWEGAHCNVNLNECDTGVHNCQNNATCVDKSNGYSCICNPGWTGEHCEQDINECDGNHGCGANANCVNDEPGFHCECNPGFAGSTCTACNYPEYQDIANQPTCKTCMTCGQGLELVGCGGNNTGQCEDINGCIGHTCSLTSICVDTPAPGFGYSCQCHPGWSGLNCDKDINECDTNRHNCPNTATCVNDVPNFHCECKVGHAGSSCTPCNNGLYQDTTNQSVCKTCQGGIHGTTNANGAFTSCSDCGQNYGKSGEQCELCQVSSYQWDDSIDEQPCRTHGKCDVGFGYKHVKSDDACSKCDSAYEFNNIDGWSPCVNKTTQCIETKKLVKNTTENTRNDLCIECPSGYQCDGTENSVQCLAGSFSHNAQCLLCPSGTYSGNGANECTVCGEDFKYAAQGQPICLNCPPGSVTSGGNNLTRSGCNECPVGHTCDGTSTKIPCDANMNATKGQTKCTVCPSGYWPDSLRETCNWCDFGYGKNGNLCEACQNSSFSYVRSYTGCVKKLCPKGTGIPSGTGIFDAPVCLDCPWPSFSDNDNTGSCETISCPEGTFFHFVNASMHPNCLPCPKDTFMNNVSHHEHSCKPHLNCQEGYGGLALPTKDRICLQCLEDVTFSKNNVCQEVTDIYCDIDEYYMPGTVVQDRSCKACPDNTYKSKTQHRDLTCDFTVIKIITVDEPGRTTILKDTFESATALSAVVSENNGTYTIEIFTSLLANNVYPDISHAYINALNILQTPMDLSQMPCLMKTPIDGDLGDCSYMLQPNKTCRPSCKSGYTLYRGPLCSHAVLQEPLCVSNLEFDLIQNGVTGEEMVYTKHQTSNENRFAFLAQNKMLNTTNRRRIFQYIFSLDETPFEITPSQAQMEQQIQTLLTFRHINKIKIIPPKQKPNLDCLNSDVDISNAPRAFEIPLQYENEVALICRKSTPVTKMRFESDKYKISCYENQQWGIEFEKMSGDTYHCGNTEFFVNSLGSTTCQVKLIPFRNRIGFGNCPQTLAEGETCDIKCKRFGQYNVGTTSCINGVYHGARCLHSCQKLKHDWDRHCCGPHNHYCKSLKAAFTQYGCCPHLKELVY